MDKPKCNLCSIPFCSRIKYSNQVTPFDIFDKHSQSVYAKVILSAFFQFIFSGHVLDHWRSILSKAAKQIGKEHLADIKRLFYISFNTEKALITGSINDIIKTQEAFLPIYKRLLPYILPKNPKHAILFIRIAECEKLIYKLKYQGGNLHDVAVFFKQSKAQFMRVLNFENK